MPNAVLNYGRWPRFLCNHNPLYLVSAWLVLHGISLAFQGEAGLRWVPLMTQLLCGYTLVLSLAGWLVVRAGKVWEDARMILLVVLLMFTALSTSYDNLCLKDPVSGAIHLAFGFAFSCAITEWILYALGMKLPLRYRAPFYLQLAVLFAFPAWLGKLSVEGRDPEMCLGVLLFPLAAAAALLTLLPAAAGAPRKERDNGTPWPWPFYPWSIFVFVAIASGIRAWMMTLSFLPVAGVEPAFLPYLLCPILIAMSVLVLEMGLRKRSATAQRFALFALVGVIALAFPGDRVNAAQERLIDLAEQSLAGPPLFVCAAVALVAGCAVLRRAAGSELVAIVSLALLAGLDVDTRSWRGVHAPADGAMFALATWQLVVGLWSRTTLRLAFGGLVLLFLAARHCDTPWMFDNNASWAVQLGMVWCVLLPLHCRDRLAQLLRESGPGLIALTATCVAVAGPTVWSSPPNWAAAATVSALTALSIAYWGVFRDRWYVLVAAWAATLASVLWAATILCTLQDEQMRRGLAWYVAGCEVLMAALVVSLWKASFIRRTWARLQHFALQRPTSEADAG